MYKQRKWKIMEFGKWALEHKMTVKDIKRLQLYNKVKEQPQFTLKALGGRGG